MIIVDESITLKLIDASHAAELHALVERNRLHLRQWLPWVDKMLTPEQFMRFAEESVQRYVAKSEIPLMIFEHNSLAGRTGLYNIDHANRIASVGYWLGKEFEGRGIMVLSTAALISYAFNQLNLNRIEIKCGTENVKSQAIPRRLNFFQEGIIREGELHGDRFIDLCSFSMLRKDWEEFSTD